MYVELIHAFTLKSIGSYQDLMILDGRPARRFTAAFLF